MSDAPVEMISRDRRNSRRASPAMRFRDIPGYRPHNLCTAQRSVAAVALFRGLHKEAPPARRSPKAGRKLFRAAEVDPNLRSNFVAGLRSAAEALRPRWLHNGDAVRQRIRGSVLEQRGHDDLSRPAKEWHFWRSRASPATPGVRAEPESRMAPSDRSAACRMAEARCSRRKLALSTAPSARPFRTIICTMYSHATASKVWHDQKFVADLLRLSAAVAESPGACRRSGCLDAEAVRSSRSSRGFSSGPGLEAEFR